MLTSQATPESVQHHHSCQRFDLTNPLTHSLHGSPQLSEGDLDISPPAHLQLFQALQATPAHSPSPDLPMDLDLGPGAHGQPTREPWVAPSEAMPVFSTPPPPPVAAPASNSPVQLLLQSPRHHPARRVAGVRHTAVHQQNQNKSISLHHSNDPRTQHCSDCHRQLPLENFGRYLTCSDCCVTQPRAQTIPHEQGAIGQDPIQQQQPADTIP